MAKYNTIQDVLEAKDALLNKLLAPAIDAAEGFTVMQTLRKNALQTFMKSSLSHGSLELKIQKETLTNLILGLNGDKDKLVEMLNKYVSDSIDLYYDIMNNSGQDLPKSTLDALFTEEFHPDLHKVFDVERKMYSGDGEPKIRKALSVTPLDMAEAGLIPAERDIFSLMQQIMKNEITLSIRHVMPEGFEMRTLIDNIPELHAEMGRLRDMGVITTKQLDDLFTLKIDSMFVNMDTSVNITSWKEYGEALEYIREEFKTRTKDFVFGLNNNNRFYSDIKTKSGDKYFALIGYGSYEQSMFNKLNRKIDDFVRNVRKELRDIHYEEMVTNKIEEAGFLSESEMLDFAGGQDYGQYDGPLTHEEVNAKYNKILQEYGDFIEGEMTEKLGYLIDYDLVRYGNHGVFPTNIEIATTIDDPELVEFVEDLEPSSKTVADIQTENQKIFDAGADLPIDENVLKQQIGGRQLGFGQDELSIIEGTAFKEIMDEMDAKGIHYSDVDIYSYIPENKRLTPYLIFKEGVRNEYFTDEFVEYLAKVSARGAFKNNPNLDFNPTSRIHEYALQGSFGNGTETFQEMLFDIILDKNNPRGGMLAKELEILFVNGIFPGGSYKANVEESNRRFWADRGMDTDGKWLPEVQKLIDEGVAFDEIVKNLEGEKLQDSLDATGESTATTQAPENVNVDELVEVRLQVTDPAGLHARPTGALQSFLDKNDLLDKTYIRDIKGNIVPYSFMKVMMLGLPANAEFSIYFTKGTDTKPFEDFAVENGIGDVADSRGGSLRTGSDFVSNHSTRVRDVATNYHTIMGLDAPEFKPAAVFSEMLGQVAAQIYDELPVFDEAALPYYKKFIDETNIQYQLLLDAGIEFELVDYDPYTPNRAGHNQMITDMENGRLKILSTEAGFGSGVRVDGRNPMLAQSRYTDVNGRVMLENDVFRAVHDTFGHGMRGNTFGPIGEYNAWLAHKEMYSRDAQRAMTTETFGQNTYVNYGPHMQDANGNMIPEGDPNYVRPQDRPFADQKTGIVPEELIDAAGTVVEDAADLVDNESMKKVTDLVNKNPGVAKQLYHNAKKIVGKAFNFGTGVLDPGDVVISQGLMRMLPRLGLGAIAAPALYAYVFYELSVLAIDAAQALQKASEKQGIESGPEYVPSFMGGKTIEGNEPVYQDVDWKQLGKDTWSEFGDISDTYSLSWKISEPIINKAFESYGKLNNTLNTAAPYSYYGTAPYSYYGTSMENK